MTAAIDEITTAFQNALNRHGYGFQYAVLQKAYELYMQSRSYWIPWVPEFPVEVQGYATRIDLVFRHRNRPLFLVCECKRANPATANWCFARASRPDLSNYADRSYIEVLGYNSVDALSSVRDLSDSQRIYQIALEVRSKHKGDPGGPGRGEIEEASTQVCRGFNGLIQLFCNKQDQLNSNRQEIAFVPVIFTTARIMATVANLSGSNLISGEVDELQPPLKESDWIWYDYPQSPGLKHSLQNAKISDNLQEMFYREYVRRIAVVSTSGLTAFLGMNVWGP